jgi:hypothetical protein
MVIFCLQELPQAELWALGCLKMNLSYISRINSLISACASITNPTSWPIHPWVPGWIIEPPGDEVVEGEKTSTSEYYEK